MKKAGPLKKKKNTLAGDKKGMILEIIW